jgi:hypothetical protein
VGGYANVGDPNSTQALSMDSNTQPCGPIPVGSYDTVDAIASLLCVEQ